MTESNAHSATAVLRKIASNVIKTYVNRCISGAL
jgi:hypothetical protein